MLSSLHVISTIALMFYYVRVSHMEYILTKLRVTFDICLLIQTSKFCHQITKAPFCQFLFSSLRLYLIKIFF